MHQLNDAEYAEYQNLKKLHENIHIVCEHIVDEFARLKQLEVENKSLLKSLTEIKIGAENNIYAINELNRLKRLDDNVKQRIKASKSLLALNAKTRSYSLEEIEEIDNFIKLLESLYDDKQG